MPATLAVVALAAFLAFGLMANTGSQQAAAQQKADCTIHIDKAAGAAETASFNVDTSDTTCDAVGDTAIVEFVGDTSATTDTTISVLIEDKSGPITAYPQNTMWNATDGFEVSNNTVSSMKYSFLSVTVPKAAQNAQGIVEGQKVLITVSGDVRAWIGTVTVHTEFEDITEADDAYGARFVITGGHGLDVTLLGAPALGKDGADLNKDIDDVVMDQCVIHDVGDTAAEAAMGTKVLDEAAIGGCSDLSPEADTWIKSEAVIDAVETRSKLVVRKGLANVTTGAAQVLFDGKKVTQTVTSADLAVTIYVLVEDAKGQELLETGVDFNATTVPTGIISDRELSDDPETKKVLVGSDPSDVDEEIRVEGLNMAITDVPKTAEILADDAVATFTLKNLDEIEGAFSITVEVTAGGLDLGTVLITRPDYPERLVAGIFNQACFDPGKDDDYSAAAFNMENDGCEAMGATGRFGAGEMIFVKAHLEDSLDNVVGNSSELDSELADDFDDPLIDGAPGVIEDPVDGKEEPRAWIYTVDKDAMLGDHMITVSTTAKNADDEDIGDVTLTISVAGPPTQYMFVDPVDNIELGDRTMFTVQAYDTNDGIPHLITMGDGKNDTVEIVVPDIAESLVRGRMLDNGVLTLDEDTGMGSFTIYAPANAPAGSTARIFVSAGDVEITHTVTFGEPGATPDPMERDGFTADYTVTATSTAGSGMVDVSWTRSEELSLSLVSLIQGDKVVDFNITPGMSTRFSEVAPGEYDVSVFSFRITEDGKDGEIAFGTVTVE